jgi:O-acetyl-ADP-ribose deacetylase (regulator of RNase III)
MTAKHPKSQDELLKICIDELLAERGTTAAEQGVPCAFNVFRALVNVREPHEPSERFLDAQDELLQRMIAEKGVTKVEDLPVAPLDARLALWQGDICTLAADGIVNAANDQLLGCWQPNHLCIDNAIHTFAGVQLRGICFHIMTEQGSPEPTGAAKITPAYNLPSKYVLHTVGPIVMTTLTQRDRELLASCYTACLDLAEVNGLSSVAFCCVSTGVFGFPKDDASLIAVATVRRWFDRRDSLLPEGQKGHVRTVVFNTFGDEDTERYAKLLGYQD